MKFQWVNLLVSLLATLYTTQRGLGHRKRMSGKAMTNQAAIVG